MNQTFQISLNELGHILIPASLRQRLGLKSGMTLVVEEAEQEDVQLRVENETPQLVDEGGILVIQGELLENIDNIVQRTREQRTQELIKRIGM